MRAGGEETAGICVLSDVGGVRVVASAAPLDAHGSVMRFLRVARMTLRTLLEEDLPCYALCGLPLGIGGPSHERVPPPSPSPPATTITAASCPPSTLAVVPPRPAVAPLSAAAVPPPPPPPPHGAPPRCPPPALPYGAPPFAMSEPPELQPKALLGPFTDVAQIKKVCRRLPNQPDRTSSVAALNAWFVRSRESHLCGPAVSSAQCFAPRWPPLVFPRDPSETGETWDDLPHSIRAERSSAGAMQEQRVVVLGVLRVCFFVTSKGPLCGACCVACTSYMSSLRVSFGGETSHCSHSAKASPGDQR